jgi:hypothetical protein
MKTNASEKKCDNLYFQLCLREHKLMSGNQMRDRHTSVKFNVPNILPMRAYIWILFEVARLPVALTYYSFHEEWVSIPYDTFFSWSIRFHRLLITFFVIIYTFMTIYIYISTTEPTQLYSIYRCNKTLFVFFSVFIRWGHIYGYCLKWRDYP